MNRSHAGAVGACASPPAVQEQRCDDGCGSVDGPEKTRRVRWQLAKEMNCCAEQDCRDPGKAYENVLGGSRKCVCEDRRADGRSQDEGGCDDDRGDADDEADDEPRQAERQECDDAREEKRPGNGCQCGTARRNSVRNDSDGRGTGCGGGGGANGSDSDDKRRKRLERQRQRKEARREREERLCRKLDAERKRADTLQCAWQKMDKIRRWLDDELARS